MSITQIKRPTWLILINDEDERAGTFEVEQTKSGVLISIFAENWQQVEELREHAQKHYDRVFKPQTVTKKYYYWRDLITKNKWIQATGDYFSEYVYQYPEEWRHRKTSQGLIYTNIKIKGFQFKVTTEPDPEAKPLSE